MGMDARRIGLVGLVVLAVMAVVPSFAMGATQSRKKAIWGPVRVDGKSQFPIYKHLGAGIYMMRDQLVGRSRRPARRIRRDPNDPAYHWPAEVDDAIAAGQAVRHAHHDGAQRHARLGEWPSGRRPLGAEARVGLRELRRRRGQALAVDPPLADLARADAARRTSSR